jgi:hypothetical protein
VALTGGEARRGEAVETSGAGTTETCWGFGAGGSRLDCVGERSSRPSDGEREKKRAREDAEASDYQRPGGGTGRKACMTGVMQIAPRTANASA